MNPIIQPATMLLPDGTEKSGYAVTIVYDFAFFAGGGPTIEWYDTREEAIARARLVNTERAEAEARMKAKLGIR